MQQLYAALSTKFSGKVRDARFELARLSATGFKPVMSAGSISLGYAHLDLNQEHLGYEPRALTY